MGPFPSAAAVLALLSPVCALWTLPPPTGYTAKLTQNLHASRLAASTYTDYREFNLSVPVDHFHNDSRYEPHSSDTFNLRYWFDDEFYEPGGPVILYVGGELSADQCLFALENGIIHEIAKATKGLGVVLEHRYYGTSVPVADLEVHDLRFLTTDQALADAAFFAENVVFKGLESVDLSPKATPWIAYGGSYAGALVAFLRVTYPDTFFGAISSSGVPTAVVDFWEYFEAARIFGPPKCSEVTGKVIHIVDNILINENNAAHVSRLKKAFGANSETDDRIFANFLSTGISMLQGYHWDPEISFNLFFKYCDIISSTKNLFPELNGTKPLVEDLVKVGGYQDEVESLAKHMLNYIGFYRFTLWQPPFTEQDTPFPDMTSAMSPFLQADAKSLGLPDWLFKDIRLWYYQVCSEWGYTLTGSGAPPDILPMKSRTIDVAWAASLCADEFNLTNPANVANINKYGSHAIAYPRLAFINGEWDPWRAAGIAALGQSPRNTTIEEPVILMDKAVHVWDAWGVADEKVTDKFPPEPVKEAKNEIREFVKKWLKDWKPAQNSQPQKGQSQQSDEL